MTWTHCKRAFVALAFVVGTTTAHAQVCPPSTVTYSDDFSSAATESSGSTVAGWGTGTISAPETNTTLTGVDSTLGIRAYAVISIGDIDSTDGDDLVVLTDMPDCHLHFLRNLGMTGSTHNGWDGDDDGVAGIADFTSAGFTSHRISPAPPTCDVQGAILVSGFISTDSNVDFLFAQNTSIATTGEFSSVEFYASLGTVSTFPTWSQFTINEMNEEPGDYPFSSPNWSYHHPSSTVLQIIDWNTDGQDDLVVASSRDEASGSTGTYDEVWVKEAQLSFSGDIYDPNPDPVLGSMLLTRPIAGDSAAAEACITDTGAVSKGITLMLAEDFDNDGDVDIVGGSMSELGLTYFDNNGTSFPSPSAGTPNPMYNTPEALTWESEGVAIGGAAYGVVVDLNGDGFKDFVVARDEEGCDSNGAFSAEPGGGRAWAFMYNSSGPPTFQQQAIPLANRGHDVDWIAKADVDNDGTMDVLVGENVIDGRYDLIRNDSTVGTTFYAATSVAESEIVDSLANATNGITRVTVDLTPDPSAQPAGTTTSLYLSNNDGRTWELANANALAGTDAHEFSTYGADLRWRVVFDTVPTDAPVGFDALVLGSASNVQPTLTGISLDVEYVGTAEYSRSGLAGARYDVDGDTTDEDVVIAASFTFPGWDGYLRASDITAVTLSSGSSLDRFDNDGATISLWEAGAVSTGDPGAGSRNILAVDDPTNATLADRTVEFTLSNVTDLMTPMGIPVQADAETAITFIRNGMSDTDTSKRKLRDFGHSSPVIVTTPPDTFVDKNLADPDGTRDYEGYITDQAGREPRVYIGGNDGMLRAFDATDGGSTSGEEIWALIPPNLLSKIGDQRQTLSDGSIAYVHDFFVDGSITVQEIWDPTAVGAAKDKWKTVLIVGQALGQAKNGYNYYFAVDVTDPDTPLFLWEFSDTQTSVSGGACDRSDDTVACSTSCSTSCGGYSCNTTDFCESTEPYHLYFTGGDITVEAEHYNVNSPANGADAEFDNVWALSTAVAGYVDDGFMSTDGDDDNDRCDNGGGLTNGSSGGAFDDDADVCAPYMTFNFRVDEQTQFYPMWRYNGVNSDEGSIWWQVDGGTINERQLDGTGFSATDWIWHNDNISFTVEAGIHTIDVYMREDGIKIDKFSLIAASSQPSALATNAAGPTETCEEICDKPSSPTCSQSCTETCVDPDTDPWPSCGAGEKCCENADSDYCHPLAQACDTGVDTVAGETFSRPVIGRFTVDSTERALAVMASGYNNTDKPNVGRSVYAIDAFTGALVGQWDIDDPATTGTDATNESDIENTLPAGVALVDMDRLTSSPGFGYVDRMYFGDLEGRLWRIDTDQDATTSAGVIVPATGAEWETCEVFDAGDFGGAFQRWAPIRTTPAIAGIQPLTGSTDGKRAPQIYFGTGGDDRATPDLTNDNYKFRFYSIQDDEPLGSCPLGPRTESDLDIAQLEWVVGDGLQTDFTTALAGSEEGDGTERYWADPVIFNNAIVLFASLQGSIESVDPCIAFAGTGKVFGYWMINDSQNQATAGSSFFSDPFSTTSSNIRSAGALIGIASPAIGTSLAPQNISAATDKPRVVIGGTAGGEGGGIDLPGFESSNPLRFINWREVPL